MRIYVVFLVMLAGLSLKAQEEVTLEIGDSLYFEACDQEAYEYIDLYVKTRFELDSISYDSLSDWAFYNRFFNTGDFDVSRLPCKYSGQFGIIKHMMSMQNPEGEWLNVVVAMIKDGKSAAYVVEQAFTEGEVWVVKKR